MNVSNKLRTMYYAFACLAFLNSAITNSMVPAPVKPLVNVISNYNPITAVTNRWPFAKCLAKACWHTIINRQEKLWNWNKINLLTAPELAQKIKIALQKNEQNPHEFLWGVGTSAHQVEGHCSPEQCTWARWEQSIDTYGNPHPDVKESSNNACNHWDKYKEDTKLIQQLGANSYRFSVDWSKIEPQEGKFNKKALQHYVDECTELNKQGIKPLLTLHHYCDPCWFLDKGGFEKEENIEYYVRFCTEVYKALHDKVHMWSTFNSPSGYAAHGYLSGDHAPGKKNMQLYGEVLKNLLLAHVQTYETLNEVAQENNWKKPTIGVTKNMYQLDPYPKKRSIRSQMACAFGSMLTNDCIFNFFNTGYFKLYIPNKVYVTGYNQKAPKSLDFVGLNYYSNGYMHNLDPVKNEPREDKQTANASYRVYPEGLYFAIKEIHERLITPLQKKHNTVKLFVTENGTAPVDDNDERRTKFYQQYLYAFLRALQDGYKVDGYITWSLMDNYEWGTYTKKYGLYRVDFSNTELPRTLKAGAHYYRDVLKEF